ncbi:unnamed protein product [Peniophora sp. CBMAI 1063]|nr:unnamed protein product [Peniophora sp. CBMAI 1063]
MTAISTLLTLPSSSRAFSAVAPTVRDESTNSPTMSRGPTGRSSSSGLVKLEISGLHPPRPPISNTELLRQARQSITVLFAYDTTPPAPLTRERLYAATRALVTSGDGNLLSDHLTVTLEKASSQMRERLANSASGTDFFGILATELDSIECRINDASGSLAYLDRLYIAEKTQGASIKKIAHSTLKRFVLERPEVAQQLETALAKWLEAEHTSGVVQAIRPSVSAVIRHLQVHGLYDLFEKFYVQRTREFHGTLFAQYPDMMEFLGACIDRSDKEIERAHAVLPERSWKVAQLAAEGGLLDGHVKELAEGVVGKLLDAKDLAKLGALRALCVRVDAEPPLVNAFRDAAEARVKTIVKDIAKAEEMVDRLLPLKETCDLIIKESFGGRENREYGHALSDAFASGYLARRRAPAEMLAKYVDRLMRKGQAGASDAEFAEKLDRVLVLYRYTDDKDVFRAFYQRALARRLLLGRSASDDFEKRVIQKLKAEYDPEFASGDQMFKDLGLSRDLMAEYHGQLERRDPDATRRLTAMILQQSVWPFTSRSGTELVLQPDLHEELARFERFYGEKHKSRRLEWNHSLGSAELTARFDAGVKTLTVSLYQASVLLLFADSGPSKRLGYAEIAAALRITDDDMRRTLQSLACGKKRVLKKHPEGRDVNDGDFFTVNESFKDPHPRVHINSIQAKETPEESRKTQDAIEGDRKHLLDAAIVRIMKANQKLMYEEIKTQTITAVSKHFFPDVASIKQRVDSLVESEYMRRDEEDRNLFYYIA